MRFLRHEKPVCSHQSAPNMNDDLDKLLELCSHSDVTFVVENKEFPLHKSILSSKSSMALGDLVDDWKKVSIELSGILIYIYKSIFY